MAKFYYAVKAGRNPGIYESWAECEVEVKGYKGAKYKKFATFEEAQDFIEEEGDFLRPKDILEDNEMVAYVDGSFCLDTRTYSYGVVILTNEGKESFSGRENNEELVQMRNVAGELMGAMFAMDYAIKNGKEILYLYYDYKGIEDWAKGHWKTNKKGTIEYKKYYDSIKNNLQVIFIKVKAHSGIEYNEEADKLAKEAILGENL